MSQVANGRTTSLGNILTRPFSAFRTNRTLLRELVKREIIGRYRGAHFGLFWSLINPVLMLAVYALAFGSIMKARWISSEGGGHAFVLILFLGIVVHGMFAECITRAPRLIQENVSYVKKIVFPLPVLGWSSVFSAGFHLLMNLVVFVLMAAFIYRDLAPTAPLIVIIIFPLVLLCVGSTWILAALGPYFRDLGQITPIIATAMFFLSSAIIPVDTLEPKYKIIFNLNPLTFLIDQSREVMLYGNWPDWQGIFIYTLCAFLLMCAGHWLFMKASTGFSDVL